MEIIQIQTQKLIPYEFNNKEHDETQINRIANSIKEFWFTQPIVIDKDNVVIIWHWRLEASKKLWLEEVPCVKMENLTEKQIKKLRILDNKLNESERDIDNLKLELDDIWDLNIWDIELSIDDLFWDLLKDDEEIETKVDDVEFSIPKEAKVVKKWDIFQLWWHRLMCWDSTNENDVELLMWWNKVDISFTSPPYNAWKDISSNTKSKYKNDLDDKSTEDYLNFLIAFTTIAMKYSEYTFVNVQSLSNNKIALIDYLYYLKDSYADTIIRDKINSQPAMWENILNSTFEYVHIFSEKWNRAIWTIPFRWTLDNIIHIWRWKNEFADVHKAVFSVDFAKFFIENFCNETVLDLFWWTWTTMIVAEQLNKKSYLMELDPLYCEVILNRFHKLNTNAEIKCLNREIDVTPILQDN